MAAQKSGITYIKNLPPGIEVTYRYGSCLPAEENGDCNIWQFVFNNTPSKQEIFINEKNINLEPFGMDIRTIKR